MEECQCRIIVMLLILQKWERVQSDILRQRSRWYPNSSVYYPDHCFVYVKIVMNSHIAIPTFEYHEQDVSLEDFELIRCIGHGAYGQVVD